MCVQLGTLVEPRTARAAVERARPLKVGVILDSQRALQTRRCAFERRCLDQKLAVPQPRGRRDTVGRVPAQDAALAAAKVAGRTDRHVARHDAATVVR